MSLQFAPSQQRREKPAWSGMSILVEAMLLLVFLVASLAILIQIFALSMERGRQGELLAQAISCATNTAERFAADPAGIDDATTEGDLIVLCDVTDEESPVGTIYHATITVRTKYDEEPLYVLTTARYKEVS